MTTVLSILTLILLIILINIVDSYHITSNKYKHVHRYNKDNDFIDAEIIDNKSSSSSSSSSSSLSKDSNDKPKGIISSLFNFGKKLINGKDNDNNKLSVLEKKKREQKAQMNSAIDELTKGTGIVGGLFGSVLKGVGGMLTESLAEASKDQTMIQDAIVNKLSISIASSKLGSNIVCGFPLQSSSSTINVNGNVQKSFSQVIQVQGSRAVGTVQAVGSVDSNGTVKFNQLLFQDSSSAITDLLGSGGGSSSGGRGTIIDTDVVN